MNHHFKAAVLSAIAVLAAACSEPNTAPTAVRTENNASVVKFWESGATTAWNELATSLADRTAINAGRLYAYLSLAQLRAAEAAAEVHPHSPTSAAIGGASAAVLNSFFPANTAEIEAALDAQEAADPWPGAKHDDFATGEALGRAVGAKVLTYAAGDRNGLADPGSPPVGAGFWTSSGAAIVRGNYRMRPFFLASDSQFRPAPPPAFGSADYLAALGEVRQISDTRTAEQLAIATYWNLQQSGRRNAVFNGAAVELIRQYHIQDAKAARIMFLMNSAVFDASIGCFDAKYHYWFIRPPQADPLITTPVGMPNHPSYPSAHSCVSGSASGVLIAFFPDEAAELDAMATEAGVSRVYAGIHYRFDSEVGIVLGRAVAGAALAANLDQVAVLP